MPENFLRAVEKLYGTKIDRDSAVKILKVYSESQVVRDKKAGEHEYDMQVKAHEIVTGNVKHGEISAVPKPLIYRDLKLSENVKKVLRAKGVTNIDDRVEVFMMDFVGGTDLGHLLYKKIATEHQQAEAYAQSTANLEDFKDVQDVAGLMLGFERPGGRHSRTADIQFEKRKIESRNYNKLYGYLEKHGHLLNPRIRKQIALTLRLFHENGLAFRDGHERNFMIEGSDEAIFDQTGKSNVQTYIIDYGSSMEFSGHYGDHLFKTEILGEKTSYLVDEAILHSIGKITPPPSSRESRILAQELDSSTWEQYVKILAKKPKGQSLLDYAWQSKNSFDDDQQITGFVAGLEKLIQDKQLTYDEAKDYVRFILENELESEYEKANQLREAFVQIKK